jgi:antitoxin component YwqK of YwqJK toxin-antitoxin module
MKLKLLFILFFVLTSSQCSWSQNVYTTYLDSTFTKVTKQDYAYYEIVRNYYDLIDEYTIELYYKSGQLKRTGVSSGRDTHRYNGYVTSYYEGGTMQEKVFHKDGLPLNTHESWYENGLKRDQGVYVIDSSSKNMNRTLRIDQYWEENGTQLVTNGEGIYHEKSNTISLKGTLKNGFKKDIWTGKDIRYKLTFKENYRNGNFISGISTDKDSVQRAYEKIMVNAAPKNGLQHFYGYVGRKFNTRNSKYYGKIVLNFVINKDGDAENLIVYRSVNSELDNEAIRVVKAYKNWKNAVYRGIAVRQLYSLPILLAQ